MHVLVLQTNGFLEKGFEKIFLYFCCLNHRVNEFVLANLSCVQLRLGLETTLAGRFCNN